MGCLLYFLYTGKIFDVENIDMDKEVQFESSVLDLVKEEKAKEILRKLFIINLHERPEIDELIEDIYELAIRLYKAAHPLGHALPIIWYEVNADEDKKKK